tara:strand:+ start:18184 stop:19536 length:1353 start_codon:yes stop_codon:yes gene_type:complete
MDIWRTKLFENFLFKGSWSDMSKTLLKNTETVSDQTRNLLLAVTGTSPAVITETLFGIAERLKKGDKEYWPDEIRIITTSVGKKEIMDRVNAGDWIHKVCEEVGQPVITLESDHILVIQDGDAKEVKDARSTEDHEALANFITNETRKLAVETGSDGCAAWRIHASIAGGRKTMTFYMGYAMSLFGRHFDRLSHVLVSEEFEGVPGFYFPTKESHRIEIKNGVLDSKDARVTLSYIPFVRMRHSLPEVMQDNSKEYAPFDYQNLVEVINLGDKPEAIRLMIDCRSNVISLRDLNRVVVSIELSNPVYFALYVVLSRVTALAGDKRCQYVRTVKNGDDETALFNDLALELARQSGVAPNGRVGQKLYSYLTDFVTSDNGMVTSLAGNTSIVGDDLTNMISEIRQKIEGRISSNLKKYLIPSSVFNEKGGIVSRGKYYGLALNPDQIDIIEK